MDQTQTMVFQTWRKFINFRLTQNYISPTPKDIIYSNYFNKYSLFCICIWFDMGWVYRKLNLKLTTFIENNFKYISFVGKK